MCLRLLVSDLDSSPFDFVAVLEGVVNGTLVHVNQLGVTVGDGDVVRVILTLCVHVSEKLDSTDTE